MNNRVALYPSPARDTDDELSPQTRVAEFAQRTLYWEVVPL